MHALCSRCGKYLCRNCGLPIHGLNFCEPCLEDVDLLTLRKEEAAILLNATRQTNSKEEAAPSAPQTLRELPQALKNMAFNGPIFFTIAAKTPFWLSFILAFLAVAPNTLVIVLNKSAQQILDTLTQQIQSDPQLIQYAEWVQSHSTGILVMTALTAAAIQVLVLDLLYHLSIRIFTKTQLSFRESSSLLHFCLTPLIFAAIGTYFDIPILQFLALGLMIIQTTTATRIATKCTLLQGLLAMIVFIVFINLLGTLGIVS